MRFFSPIKFWILLIVVISTSSRALALENIALTADTILTSHVSPWEDLFTINNGIDPESSGDKSGGAYGNWTGDDNKWQWVEYDWDQLYRISRSDVYWWADGLGIVIPNETYQEYWDFLKRKWVRLPDAIGNGTEADQYNITTFTPVLTNKIRVYMISDIATGILEWRIWGSLGEQAPMGTSIEIDKPLTKNDTSEVTIVAKDESYNPVQGYVFILDIKVINDLLKTTETYVIDGNNFTSSYSGYPLPPTNEGGEAIFHIIIPASIDHRDGLSVQVLFSDSLSKVGEAFTIFEPGLLPPTLIPDQTDNTVDQGIEISFNNDPDWVGAIKNIYANDSLLVPVMDYDIEPGNITLKPSSGNPTLISAGRKKILIAALGYEDNSVVQEILPGMVNATESSVRSLVKLFKNVTTDVEIIARDQFGNLIKSYQFKYDIVITNNDATTSELYRVSGADVSSDITDQQTSSTDSLGKVMITLSIPGNIDLNDGIGIFFKTQDGTPVNPAINYVFDGSEKQVLVQSSVKANPAFNWERTAQSDNFIIYWGDLITGDPADRQQNPDLWFNTSDILEWLENIRKRYRDSLGFLDPNGNDAIYKHEVVMNETWSNGDFTGWAFGAAADMTIGGLWIHPGATRDDGVLAHEFCHACQTMVMIDKPGYGLNTPYAGFFWESHANFMSCTYDETRNGIPERFILTAMMHYSTTRRHYQNLPFLDYLYDTYGMETINKIWQNANPTKSHPLTSLRDSVLRYSQDDLHNDFARHAMKNITWDYVKTGDWWREAMQYVPEYSLGRLYTILDSLKGEPGKFIVPEYIAPGDYGYNIIPLYPDDGVTEIQVEFNGLENDPAGGSGSRYGFVALNYNGIPRYSDIYTEQDNLAQFPIQPDDSAVFMVVTGAPKQHHNYPWEVGYPKNYRYPYIVQFTGAVPAGHKPGYNSLKEKYPGAPHPNGGGWVASTARVASTAYVGPNAQVLRNAVISGNARIEGYAIITDDARVRDNTVVKDHVIVYGNSYISGNAVVEKTARLYNTRVNADAVVTGSALVGEFTLNDHVVVKDLAILWNGTLSGTTIVGGDAEEYTGCSSGTYLDINRTSSGCDGKIYHNNNIEVNPAWPEYIYPAGDKPARPMNISVTNVTSSTVGLHWDAAKDDDGIYGYYVMKKRFTQIEMVGISTQNSFIVTGLNGNTIYSFFVRAVDLSGNISQYSDTVDIKTAVTGLAQESLQNILVYPNPSGDLIHIEMPYPEESQVTIFDLFGKEIYHNTFREKINISKSEIGTQGVYILRITNRLHDYTTRIIIYD
jgi:carbonic anhydrase/acetyltransferase-like protein (isoleucine patch superfamily)